MTALLIPTRTDAPRYSIRVDLDGDRFVLNFEWNDRALGWFLDIDNEAGERLISGVRISVNFPILNRYVIDGLPKGILIALDSTAAGIDPLREDLGDRVRLVYFPVADLPASVFR